MSESGSADRPTTFAIRRRSDAERDEDLVGFKSLRALGIERVQDASGKRWTDYNLHDPGVTILEQLCYALTELTYRADLPVADHLCDMDGRIDFERLALFPPEQILPCRPTSSNDYRRILLDRNPRLGAARFATGDPPSGTALAGLHRLRLRPAYRRDRTERDDRTAVAHCVAAARETFRANRGLGEDLDDHVAHIASRPCELILSASVSGFRDPVDVLAEIFHRCEEAIAAAPSVSSFEELLRGGQPPEEVFDGPWATAGVIAEKDLETAAGGSLVVSRLRAILLNVPGVEAVTALAFRIGGTVASSILEWPADDWAPRLCVPGEGPEAADLSLVKLTRRGAEVVVDERALATRYGDDMRPVRGAGHMRRELQEVVPRPRGVHRPPLPYDSIQNQFPPIYGLGPHGLPSEGGRSRTDQFKAYLAMFDQVLANGAAQVDHIRHLFTPDRSLGRSYWRRIVDDGDAARIEALYRRPFEETDTSVDPWLDDEASRRARVLDYLLSLYGETLSQNMLRQFLDYLDSRELAEALVDNKATYLKQVVTLSRDRAAGFDYGAELWGSSDRTPGFHRRICLLLGFGRWHARPLCGAIRRWGFDAEAQADPRKPAPRRPAETSLRPLAWPKSPGSARLAAAPLRRLRRDRKMHAGLLVHGVNRERYFWQAGTDGGPGRLLLVADRGDGWWDLGPFDDEAKAGELADGLRRRLLRLNRSCEGLHVVEHILLRPRVSGRRLVDPEFHGLRVTLVFPDWTARTVRPAFKAFAEETVRINCPAHIDAECLWLDFPSMSEFEKLYATWLAQLRRHAEKPRATAKLDAAAADLEAFLRNALRRKG